MTQAHATLSASGMFRWKNCPGSVRLEEGRGEGTPSPYALEGIEAHKRAEALLKKPTLRETQPHEFDLDLKEYIDTCILDAARSIGRRIEARVDLDLWFPGEKMFGTADHITWDNELLTVRDLKFGKGQRVFAQGNDQLKYYALGALVIPPSQIKRVKVAIHQPRVDHGTTEDIMDVTDLLNWLDTELRPAVERVKNEPNTLVAGDWCRFCRARSMCPALQQKAMEVAKTEFEKITPPSVQEMSSAEISHALDGAEVLDIWIKAVRAEGSQRMDRGEKIPGWKLVAKRALRHWKDEDEVKEWVLQAHGEGHTIFDTKLKSPAQLDKLFKDVPEDLWEKKSSGTTLVPDHDVRKAAATGPAADFEPIDEI